MRTLLIRVAAVALVAGFATGCTTARTNLGTSDSSCYLALPAATKAVEGHGHLLGVKLFTLAGLRKEAPRLYSLVLDGQPKSERVCVAAFSGNFRNDNVSHPLGRPSGHLAVVVTATPTNKLLGTAIFLQVPLRFGHSHIG
ncbi:MAG TPA: hypothetical protein VNG12_15345 [Acidimicrobiales bacterium]|nr:hypothetical protein [Acidimicrobiales bacterium]